MNYQNRIGEIPAEDFFGKGLKGKVEKWNDTLADLQGQLAEIPRRRAALSVAVAEATIGGAEAVAERKAIYEAEVALQIDLARHVQSKVELDEPIRAAYRGEADKLKAGAEKRQDAILGQLGDLLNGQQKAQAVKGDSTFSSLTNLASGYLQAATVGILKGPHSAAGWEAEYARNMASVFGAVPAAPGAGRETVIISNGAQHSPSIFK